MEKITSIGLVLDFGIVINAAVHTFCVSFAEELTDALTSAASNGQDDVVQIEQGYYLGNFVYASTQASNIFIEGGYSEDCASKGDNAFFLQRNSLLCNVGSNAAPSLPEGDKDANESSLTVISKASE